MMDWRHSDAYGCLSDDIESEQRSRRFVEVVRNPLDVTEERDGFIFSCFVLSDEGELWNLCRRLTVRGITKRLKPLESQWFESFLHRASGGS